MTTTELFYHPDFSEAFINHVNNLTGKEFYMCDMSGAISVDLDNGLNLAATPFWDGVNYVPVAITDENGEVVISGKFDLEMNENVFEMAMEYASKIKLFNL